MTLLVLPDLSAQGAGNPAWWGQWSGPYNLSQTIAAGNREIAHAIVVPPADGQDSRVFFMARKPNCGKTGQVEGFVWLGDRPMSARKVVLASSPADASEDAFCSGHTLLPNGNVLIAGGLDDTGKCLSLGCNPDQSAFGHKLIRELDTTTDPPTWVEPAVPLLMNRERWYPTVITLDNGDPFIAGHGLNAEPDGPVIAPGPCPPLYGDESIHQTWDRITWNPLGLIAPALTISRKGTNCNSSDDLVSVGEYPRLHLLTTGMILQTNTLRASFLDVLNPACNPGLLNEEERWEENALSMPSVDRQGGNSVHLVYPDPSLLPGQFDPIDVIYAIGGTNGKDDKVCDPEGAVYAEVDKYVQPGLGTLWDYSAPDLNYARFNHNSVLLLDGSILVNGGADGVTCAGDPLPPERYRPPEIFGPAQGASWSVSGAIEPAHRRYHSVAGLLPDGRVFSAGGNFTADYHTVSLYEPPYFFYARPEITSSPTETKYSDPPFVLEVTLSAATSTVERVAVVRTGSITHAWDMNQRYVVLEVVNIFGTPPNLTLQVQPPANGYIAPPGYYFLTVVEKTPLLGEGKWVPSPGQWIRVDE